MASDREKEPNPGASGVSNASGSVAWARRFLVAQWLLALVLAALAVFSLLFEPVRAALAEAMLPVVALLGVYAFVLALLSIRAARLFSGVSLLAQHLSSEARDDTPAPVAAPAHPDLQPLAKTLNTLLGNVQSRQQASVEVLTSNRAFAQDLSRLEALTKSIRHGIVVVDRVGRVILANRAAQPFLSMNSSEARGHIARECLASAEALGLLDTFKSDAQGHGIRSVEIAKSDGAEGKRYFVVSRSHGLNERDEPVGQVLLFEDVSHVKKTERQHVEFVQNVAENVTQSLTAIREKAEELIASNMRDTGKARAFANLAHREAYGLEDFIRNLSHLSILENDPVHLDTQSVHLGDFLQASAREMAPACEEKRIHLIVEVAERLPIVNIDPKLFALAIRNILSNAVRFTPFGGAISLTTPSIEPELSIAIQDNGIGIAKEDLPHVFDRFYVGRGRESGAADDGVPVVDDSAYVYGASGRGCGIGLSVARQVLRLHGGTIQALSKPGSGSQFTILLPRALINTAQDEPQA